MWERSRKEGKKRWREKREERGKVGGKKRWRERGERERGKVGGVCCDVIVFYEGCDSVG